ncbi:hypothetical protein EZV62_006844 [Acer yangbiense]|uniref:Uncharacterized protein n=1 Tax=Acer yangbiense TaxID=1000413 RepID=A0A5C7I9Z2_9ROSI|nr:hypothetical protein EZV62_006844 [Acer yangbiense]
MPAMNTKFFCLNSGIKKHVQKFLFKHALNISKSMMLSTDWVLCNPTYDLESATFNMYPKILPIGPLMASNESATCDQTQFEEFATGLKLSNRPFLWVVPPDIANNLNGSFLEEYRDIVDTRGHIISWAPQQKVLKHLSIACFSKSSNFGVILELL